VNKRGRKKNLSKIDEFWGSGKKKFDTSGEIRRLNKTKNSVSNKTSTKNHQAIRGSQNDAEKSCLQMKSDPIAVKTSTTDSTGNSNITDKLLRIPGVIELIDNDVADGSDDCAGGFKAPSPTVKRYTDLPKVDFLSDDDTPELKAEGTTERKSCPYCGETLPVPLPPRIRAYLLNVDSSSNQTPSPSVLLNRSTSVVEQFEFCRLHDAESNIVPGGLRKSYPLTINFDEIPTRVQNMLPELEDVATGRKTSLFRDVAMEAYNTLGKAKARKPTKSCFSYYAVLELIDNQSNRTLPNS
ncbi:161_t:CDS:2, partial [Acaulospora colombiana]